MASEGINLHHQSHRLIHFDIPWSLMVFQQRNGRVDRYGQKKTPLIAYLLNQTAHPKIKGDLRVIEILTDKDEQAAKNIGDPSAFMGLYDEELEVGVRCMAAGIHDDQDKLVAGLSISAPADRLEEAWVDRLKQVAAQISATLGHRG